MLEVAESLELGGRGEDAAELLAFGEESLVALDVVLVGRGVRLTIEG